MRYILTINKNFPCKDTSDWRTHQKFIVEEIDYAAVQARAVALTASALKSLFLGPQKPKPIWAANNEQLLHPAQASAGQMVLGWLDKVPDGQPLPIDYGKAPDTRCSVCVFAKAYPGTFGRLFCTRFVQHDFDIETHFEVDWDGTCPEWTPKYN